MFSIFTILIISILLHCGTGTESEKGLMLDVVSLKDIGINIDDSLQYEGSKKIAVVIGVNSYPEESNLRPLKYAVNDAKAISELLEGLGFTVFPLLNEVATQDNIFYNIEGIADLIGDEENSTVIITFSGHGFANDDEDDNLLCAIDTKNTHPQTLKGSAVSVKWIVDTLEKNPAKRKMVFIDACRNKPFIDAGQKGSSNSTITDLQL